MGKRRKEKIVPVLDRYEAMAKLNFIGFYTDVYETTYDFVEERFLGKMVHNKGFKKRFYKTFKKRFDDIYYGDMVRMVKLYHREYRREGVHPKGSFQYSIVSYIYDELEIIFCEGTFTSGQGAIYPLT